MNKLKLLFIRVFVSTVTEMKLECPVSVSAALKSERITANMRVIQPQNSKTFIERQGWVTSLFFLFLWLQWYKFKLGSCQSLCKAVISGVKTDLNFPWFSVNYLEQFEKGGFSNEILVLLFKSSYTMEDNTLEQNMKGIEFKIQVFHNYLLKCNSI